MLDFWTINRYNKHQMNQKQMNQKQMNQKPRKRYTNEFKAQAVELSPANP